MFISTGTAEHPLGHRFHRDSGFAFWTLAALPEGAVDFESRNARCLISSPRILLVPPDTPYAIAHGGDGRGCWRETWVIFAPPAHWHDLLAWPSMIPGLMTLPASGGPAAAALAQFEEVHRIASGPLPHRDRFAENALERGLLLARLAHPDAGAGGPLHAGVRATRDHLATAPAGKITIAGLARRARMSPSLLAHRFTEQIGETPMRFLERCRIDRAKRLLISTNLPIADVAAECGFDDAFHFSTRFRRMVGRSPRAYRQDPKA